MDELKMRLSTKFMKNMVSKIISKSVYKKTGYKVNVGRIWWNAGSLHIYERHFKHLEKLMSNE